MLDHVGLRDVPVGVGSTGKAYTPQPHEYDIQGYDKVDTTRLVRDSHDLLLRVLSRARPGGVRVVCISSMRDLADLMATHPDLVLSRVTLVGIQAGLEADNSPSSTTGWKPDTSVNNEFDREAASAVFNFCFHNGLPMHVVSRHAVPLLPMQLAKSFAERTTCPVMRYLANAQFLGLEGLWQKLCAGLLPARCTRLWYFETFCGVTAADDESRQAIDALDETVDIRAHLNGFVKPYDVVALMLSVPLGTYLLPPDALYVHNHTEHHLLLSSDHAVSAVPVVELLRDVYHEVVLATAKTQDKESFSGFGTVMMPQTSASGAPGTRSRSRGRTRPGSGVFRAQLQVAEREHRERAQRRSERTSVTSSEARSRKASLISSSSSAGPPPTAVHPVSTKPASEAAAQVQPSCESSSCQGSGRRGSACGASLTAPSAAQVHANAKQAIVGGPLGRDEARTSSRRASATSSEGSVETSYSLSDARVRAVRRTATSDLVAELRSLEIGPDGTAQLAPLNAHEAIRIISTALDLAHARQRALWRLAAFALVPMAGLFVIVIAVELVLAVNMAAAAAGGGNEDKAGHGLSRDVSLRLELYWLGACVLLAMLLAPLRPAYTQARRIRVTAAAWVAVQLVLVAVHVSSLVALTHTQRSGQGDSRGGPPRTPASSAGGLHARALGVHAAFNALAALPLCLIALVTVRWAHVPLLLRATWAEAGAFVALDACLNIANVVIEPMPQWRAAVMGACAGLRLCVGVALITLRARIQAVVARGVTTSGVTASLAPLVGFGSVRGPADARSLCAEAGATSEPVALTRVAMRTRNLIADLVAAPAGAQRMLFRAHTLSQIAASREPSSSDMRNTTGALHQLSASQLSSHPSWGGAKGPAPTSLPARGSLRTGTLASLTGAVDFTTVNARDSSVRAPKPADAYVVHSDLDDAASRTDALLSWAADFRRLYKRPPRVYMDCLCADEYLEPSRRLAYTPLLVGASRKLLVLPGPCMLDDLLCVAELFTWEAVGGSLKDGVELRLATANKSDVEATVAAFDAFHVMYATSTEHAGLSEQLDLMVTIATQPLINRAVRNLLPIVQDAADKAMQHHNRLGGSLHGELEAADEEDESDGDDDDHESVGEVGPVSHMFAVPACASAPGAEAMRGNDQAGAAGAAHDAAAAPASDEHRAPRAFSTQAPPVQHPSGARAEVPSEAGPEAQAAPPLPSAALQAPTHTPSPSPSGAAAMPDLEQGPPLSSGSAAGIAYRT